MRAWADRGQVPSRRTAGGHRRFRREDLEAWATSHIPSQPVGAQVVIQSALGRARLEFTEGALRQEAWYRQLDDETRRHHREAGRRLLSLMMRYLADDAESQSALEAGREIGREYERLGREGGMSLTATVRAYLFFQELLYQSVVDMHAAAGPGSALDWDWMHRRIAVFTNEVLLALVEAHRCAALRP